MTRRQAVGGGLALLGGGASAAALGAVPAPGLTTLRSEDGRSVQVSHWRPPHARRGTILFSHGARSRPEKYLRVILPWAAAGFEILAPLHVDSSDHPDNAKFGMIESWRARLLDMRALSRQVGRPYAAVGHSYGGLVALTLGGAEAEVPPGVSAPLRDPAARCVVALSPPGISPGLVTQAGYATLAVPAIIQTGDRDIPRLTPDKRWQSHLAAFEAAPEGDKYALVLEGVDHYFGGLICEPTQPGPPAEAQLATTVKLTSEFLAAYALNDRRARAQLVAGLSDAGPIRLARK